MCELFDYEAMAKSIPLKLMMLKRVREPTLWEVQKDPDRDFSLTPAWLSNSELHPGLPEHYLTLCSIEHDESSTEDDVPLPKLPFEVNREISVKLIITPVQKTKNRKLEKLPKLSSLVNGAVIISGPSLCEPDSIEIFLLMFNKLLSCCYTKRSEVIIHGPASTATGRARCYYIPDSSAKKEISFISSDGKILHFLRHYSIKLLHGSTPYHKLHC